MKVLAASLFALFVAGCADRQLVYPQPSIQAPAQLVREPETLKIRETHTLAETGRIWLIQHGHDGHDRVILCDAKFVDAGKPLCVRWPGVPEDVVSVPVVQPFR